MRGVWWSAFALLLVAVAVGALRTAQVEEVSRNSRRLPSSIKNITSIEPEDASPSPRTRSFRRREETTTREVSRSRGRSRSSDVTTSTTETLQFQSERNERFDSKRQNSRTRSRPVINEENFDTTKNRDTQPRSRSRQVTRRVTSQPTTTPTPLPVSSLTTSRKELTDSAFNDISKTLPKEVTDPNNQFRRRSSTERVIEPITARTRNRINTRTNIRALDLEVSGTANALTTAFREPTTAKTNDLRNSRKLKYKTRPSEVDSNLTGEGLTLPNDIKSSQIGENVTSQTGSKLVLRSTTEKIIRQATERISKTSTIKATKVVKRPIPRGKVKAPVVTDKPKVSDEVHEDDNYPETFKALIQTKNASTQASSPPSESLSVKASQKVYNTYNTSSQSILTAPDSEKQFRLRSKINLKENNNESKINATEQEETTLAPKQLKPKSPEYRLRGSYIPRNKKSSSFSSSTISSTSFSPVTQRSYKFSRKQKIGTTETINVDNSIKTKRVENNNNFLKKPVIRAPLYSRRNVTKNFSVNSEVPKRVEIDRSDKSLAFKSKPTLPRTSYYSRVRSSTINKTLSINSNIQSTTEEVLIVEKKVEDTAELPLIYTNTNSVTTMENDNKDNEIKHDNNKFIITINSRESTENGTFNEEVDKTEDSGSKPSPNVINTTQKYHATYKDNNNGVSLPSREKVTVSPLIRNIQTRKYGRKPIKRKEDVSNFTSRPIVRSSRKYSDTFSKTTEPSSNGIIGEPEKVKNKFSSKYRASYLDKPFYKPTVPTVTPTTAWLKFFVTDHLLSKSVEEPNWFEDEDFSDVTTEQMSRQNATSPSCMHETALPPVEGEEIQLGPDMNAISITKSRSPLTSADLKLSESLAQSLQVMNVEASNHSPSVTVSIFDALADILTSTPKPRISTTTEVLQFQNTNNDVKQTLAGVSNSINVNSVKDLTSQDTFMSTEVVATVDKNVQITEQSTSPVFNRMPVEGNITPSQIIEAGITSTVNTLSTFPFPTSPPSTPVSARRPFAIKLLYADTERPTDRTTIVTTTDKSTTDTSTRVYNTVSDLILSNNKIVSSELTSMLSSNIKNIIENMDEDSKARLSVDMVKLLNTLIPKLSKRIIMQDDLESLPNTTPYSLEDIKDTENIDINNEDNSDVSDDNILQNVGDINIVNSTTRNIESEVTTILPTETVNSTVALNKLDSTTTFPLGTQSISITPKNYEINITQSTEPSSINLSFPNDVISTGTSSNIDIDLSSPVADVVIINNDSGLSLSNVTNIPSAVPFLTNFILNDFNDMENSTLGQMSPIPPMASLQVKELEDIENIQDPSQLSRLQLWILSKKARVLKMIEDIIRNHNDEILNAPLTELVNDTNQNNVLLSSRLSDIVNTMNMTTTTNENILNMPTSTSLTITETTTSPAPFTSSQTNINLSISEEIFSTTQADITMTTTTSIPLETASVVLTSTELPAFQFNNDIADAFSGTTVGTTTIGVDDSATRLQMATPNAALDQSTTINTIMETITSFDSEIVTEPGTTESLIETTTAGLINTTILPTMSESSSYVNNINSQIKIGTPSTNPKKDYVIFGILPNNTVVRKDPNDNVLETLTEASPYIIYGVLPNNTVIRKFPNGTRVPRIMQKIDILPISPWSLRNPYSPIHNIPAIVRPQSNPIRVSTNSVTFKDTSNNEMENQLTTDTVNNLQITISSSALNIKDSSSLGITTSTNKPPAEKSTASHVLSLRTTTMLPSVDEILLNSISSATKEEMVISSMTSSTSEPRILTLDIDPETKQIRTEKPVDGNGNAVFKFIPIDEVTVSPQESNVLRLASTKTPKTAAIKETQTTVSEPNTQLPIEMTSEVISSPSDVPILMNAETTSAIPQSSSTFTTMTVMPTATETTLTPVMVTEMTTTITTSKPTTNIPISSVTQTVSTFTSSEPTTVITTSTLASSPTVTMLPIQTSTSSNIFETAASNQKDAELLQSLLQGISRTPKNLNGIDSKNVAQNIEQNENVKLLQAILAGGGQNLGSLINQPQTTTVRSIEDDIRQFEEDTKLLKALLLATGRNPQELNLPSLDAIRRVTSSSATNETPSTTTVIASTTPATIIPTTTSTTTTTPTTTIPTTTTSTTTTSTTTTSTTTTPSTTTLAITTTIPSSTTTRIQSETTTSSLNDDLRRLQEDTKLLQALLQATGNQNAGSLPIISGLTSNIRVASNPLTTSIESNPTTAFNLRPVYTTRPSPVFNSFTPETVSISTLQPQQSSTENIRISTTFRPFTERSTTIENLDSSTATTRRSKAARFQITTEIPSTSTFSDEEDLLFLQNLKSVLSSKTDGKDPETALANRVIALAVERSLNEIQGSKLEASTTMKPRTTTKPTTTTRPTTTRPTTTTARLTAASTLNTPSIEDDIKQFEEDTKLLQALLKATGQDPSKFNIPTLNTIRPASDVKSEPNVVPTTAKPYGAKIAVKDDLNNEQDDAKLLQTLIKLQDAQETTTQRGKIAFTGQSSDEALKKLLQQAQPAGMVSEATKSSISLSTEYGNSNDALLAALLKEQGFGPTTASSIDEQLRLAALLNQVVVTPKARRTTTPPPPPAPRRPLLDGLAWLWQQWRETAPGPGQPRPNRRPEQPTHSNSPSAATSSRVNWFGSGPFVGNADERPTSNRIPLEPPSVVTSEQGPGRGQLVSAAINVTRAFSQFLGAAIQGAAQTVQSVIRAGQKVATDAYTGGSG